MKYGVWAITEYKAIRDLYPSGWVHGSHFGQRRKHAAFPSFTAAKVAIRKLRKTSNALTGWRAYVRELTR